MGRMLSIPDEVVYIQEPFNLETSEQSTGFRFRHWFPYTPGMAEREVVFHSLRKTLEFRYLPPRPPHLGPYRALKRTARLILENSDHRWHQRRPLLKDPLALFSAEDLAERFDLQVVCMVRHPLAFCSSLKKWDWRFPFQHFLEQPVLMERHFQQEAGEIEAFARTEQPVVAQAALLWRLFHKVIRGYQDRHPDWHFPRHSEMVGDPLPRFEQLYQKLGLRFDQRVVDKLEESLHSRKGETQQTIYQPRDASTVTQTWKRRLAPDEIRHILDTTAELRAHFYPEEADHSQIATCERFWGWSSRSRVHSGSYAEEIPDQPQAGGLALLGVKLAG